MLELVDRVEWSTKERQRELFEKTEEQIAKLQRDLEQQFESKIGDVVSKANASLKIWAEKKMEDKIAVSEKKLER